MNLNDQRCRNLLIAARKIIQAIDQHSSQLKKSFDLTGPQLIIMQSVFANDQISVTPLSKDVSLSQATVTNITKRLEKQGFLERKRSLNDKRGINISVTGKGKFVLEKVPPLLQKIFTDRFSRLEDWEQLMIQSAFNRVVAMMSAEGIDTSPNVEGGEHLNRYEQVQYPQPDRAGPGLGYDDTICQATAYTQKSNVQV